MDFTGPVWVGRSKEVKLWIASDGDSLQDDHGPGDEGEVLGHQEGVEVEHTVQVGRDSPELFPPANLCYTQHFNIPLVYSNSTVVHYGKESVLPQITYNCNFFLEPFLNLCVYSTEKL